MCTNSSRADLAPMFTPRQEFSHKFRRLTTCCLRLDALRLLWQFLLQSETQRELWQSDPTPPWCFQVPTSLVPFFLAGVDLCHWRYCPLFPRGAALPVHKINASSQHNLKPEPSPAALCHDSFNFDTRKTTNLSLLHPAFLFIVFVGMFGLVLHRIYPDKRLWNIASVCGRPRATTVGHFWSSWFLNQFRTGLVNM